MLRRFLIVVKNFVNESSFRRQEAECAGCEAATANIEVMRKAELMTTAGEHFLNPKKHWTIPKLKDKLVYHYREVHDVAFEPDISKFLE